MLKNSVMALQSAAKSAFNEAVQAGEALKSVQVKIPEAGRSVKTLIGNRLTKIGQRLSGTDEVEPEVEHPRQTFVRLLYTLTDEIDGLKRLDLGAADVSAEEQDAMVRINDLVKEMHALCVSTPVTDLQYEPRQ